MIFNLVENKDGEVVTNSMKVAGVFGKDHRDVTKKIKVIMEKSGDFGVRNFSQSSYISKQNKKLACFDMTKDGFTMLAMSYTTEKAFQFKIQYIEQFNAMEKALSDGIRLTDQINKATLAMEQDESMASVYGKGLSDWRKKKVKHTEKIEKLISASQQLLDFK